jgi:hypothetical protein
VGWTHKLEETWEASLRERWDPAKLPWDTLNAAGYTWEQREAIAYWWSLLSIFNASAPPQLVEALTGASEARDEEAVRRALFSVARDEQNHQKMCKMAIRKLLGTAKPLEFEPHTELGRAAQRNIRWLYGSSFSYWNDYRKAVLKCDLAVFFSSFLMTEIAAATILHPMARAGGEPAFTEAFRNMGRDEDRHLAICMSLMERDCRRIVCVDAGLMSAQINAAYAFVSALLFEPREGFWDLPSDFIDVHRHSEDVARAAAFGIPAQAVKKTNWHNAMLNLNCVLGRYGLPLPAIG